MASSGILLANCQLALASSKLSCQSRQQLQAGWHHSQCTQPGLIQQQQCHHRIEGVAPCSARSRQKTSRLLRTRAGYMDVMPAWTLDQIAGLVFGAVMLASVLSARTVDEWVARAQRRQLGICETCGGINDPAICNQGKCPMKK